MKQTLIKLSDTHYIIVDDSEIKEGNWCIYNTGEIIQYLVKLNTDNIKKITHSTQPLEEDIEFVGTTPKITLKFINIKPLSLPEVEEAINGYSVEKMAYDYDLDAHENIYGQVQAFKAGFKAHQELVKDNLFTDKISIESLQELINEGYDPYDSAHHLQVQRMLKIIEIFIQSLLPKTEWDIEFNEQDKIKLI